MEWRQGLEVEDLDGIDELISLIDSLETEGTIQRASFEIVADAPINAHPPSTKTDTITETNSEDGSSSTALSSDSSHKYTTKASSSASTTATHKQQSESTPTVDDSSPPTKSSPVAVRKWPRMRQELGTDSDHPISAAAYPAETVDFDGYQEEDVEKGTIYEARVNGIEDYGAFLTLNGDGYSPHSKYNEVTGLLHHSKMLRKGPLEYTQGDSVIVDLIDHTEKGLALRERPLLSVEQAKQARHSEVVRLNRLNTQEGDEIRFSKWPDERERTGTVKSVNEGSESPPTPPKIEVSTATGTHEIRPSEIVATAQPITAGERPRAETGAEVIATNGAAAIMDASTIGETADITVSSEDDSVESASAPDGETSGEAVEAADDSARSDDEEDANDDSALECACGQTFDSEPQMWGHQSSCEVYQAGEATEEDVEDGDTDEDADDDSGTNAALNPILLDSRYQYSKVAMTLLEADGEELSVRDTTDLLEGTEWEMNLSSVNTHLETLRDKDAATRRDADVFMYSLTDRGAAGAERAVEEVGESKIPDF